MQVETTAPKKDKKQPANKAPAKRKKDESSSESDDSESEEAAPPKKVKTTTKAPKKKKDGDSSSSEEEEAPPKKKASAKPTKAPKKKDSDSDSSSEEEKAAPKKKASAKPAKAAPKKDEESDDDSSEEEEEAPPTKAAKKESATVKPAKASKKVKAEESSEDSSEEEEEAEPVKKKTEKPTKAAATKESSSSSEDSSEEEEKQEPKSAAKKGSESSSDEDEEEEKGSKAKLNGSAAKKEPVTVMCRNVPMDATISKLEKFFNKKGIECTEIRKRDNKMFAHVDLKNPADLDKVLGMNGVEFKGSELTFEKALPFGAPKTPRNASAGNADDNAVMFVKNLPNAATEDDIRQRLTEMFSGVESVRIPMNGDMHKGFAYVQFNDTSTVKETIENHQGIDYDGRPLYLDYSGGGATPQKRAPRNSFGGGDAGEKGNVLFVRNLSYDSTEDSLRDVFTDATEVRLPRQQDTGRHKGFAFVEFDSISKAEEAFNNFNQTEVDGRLVYISYSNSGKGRDGGRGGKFGGRGGGFGGRGGGGRGRGGSFGRGRGGNRGRGGFAIGNSSGKKKTFDSDSD